MMDSWEAIRSLDEEENWTERNRVLSKDDHLLLNDYAKVLTTIEVFFLWSMRRKCTCDSKAFIHILYTHNIIIYRKFQSGRFNYDEFGHAESVTLLSSYLSESNFEIIYQLNLYLYHTCATLIPR